ncbi:hypothetical protein GMRT_13228 [Giardia muris]|uniref:Uncharacterized protein n=1 Tax=Giardia muris TaxID=5742 RepID=A0A4Z1SS05_GIAMU|nr:hypothetical protein GMRT_13228 [Giardia muris]|eukprot:TNJ28702.1 hypothetical protein GMRT_13228 [Giardia muris]
MGRASGTALAVAKWTSAIGCGLGAIPAVLAVLGANTLGGMTFYGILVIWLSILGLADFDYPRIQEIGEAVWSRGFDSHALRGLMILLIFFMLPCYTEWSVLSPAPFAFILTKLCWLLLAIAGIILLILGCCRPG